MRQVDIEQWERKEHYQYFKGLDIPYFNITANLDISEFYRYLKIKELPFFISLLFAATKTANEIKEFRYRIRGDQVVDHEVVSPSFTVMTDRGVFGFCTAPFHNDFPLFLKEAKQQMETAKKRTNLTDEPGRDDLIYVTSIPWVSFTGISHPMHLHPADSIPRFAWGKYYEANGEILIPFSVQAHHGLADGEHVGRFFNSIQNMLDQPVLTFGA